MTLAVEAEQLVKHYSGRGGEVEAVRGVDLQVNEARSSASAQRRGQVDDRPDADDAHDDHLRLGPRRGHRRGRRSDGARRRIGVALQEAGLRPRQTGRELVVLQAASSA